ncbi:MAG: hypothetical protein IBGAMO2_940004 [Arenicellales bacterium IbO2]|nr:MAG: hypothetical protein IBGAMO2_940004 [Arenicellales bacterium IbO2]
MGKALGELRTGGTGGFYTTARRRGAGIAGGFCGGGSGENRRGKRVENPVKNPRGKIPLKNSAKNPVGKSPAENVGPEKSRRKNPARKTLRGKSSAEKSGSGAGEGAAAQNSGEKKPGQKPRFFEGDLPEQVRFSGWFSRAS